MPNHSYLGSLLNLIVPISRYNNGEAIENYRLFIQAEKRMSENKNSQLKSHSQVMESLNIGPNDLEDIEVDVD